MSVRIVCINKDNGDHDDPHESISHYGWQNENDGSRGKSTRSEMVKFIETDKGQAYVKDSTGNVAYCVVRTNPRTGNKFLQTIADSRFTNNLLSLMECR